MCSVLSAPSSLMNSSIVLDLLSSEIALDSSSDFRLEGVWSVGNTRGVEMNASSATSITFAPSISQAKLSKYGKVCSCFLVSRAGFGMKLSTDTQGGSLCACFFCQRFSGKAIDLKFRGPNYSAAD